MTIQLSETQERKLAEISAANGVAVDELAGQAIDHFLAYRTDFEAAVREGRAAAARGELFEHEEVVARIERLLE